MLPALAIPFIDWTVLTVRPGAGHKVLIVTVHEVPNATE